VIHSVLFVGWQISIDYKAVDQGCPQNPIEKWIPIASGYELCIKIGSILVSYIHSHLVLVVGINNNRYIKLFLAFSRKKCGICSTCIGTPSAKCNSVRKPHTILPDTLGYLTSAFKYFQMLPDPPGAKQSALRLCNSILRCS